MPVRRPFLSAARGACALLGLASVGLGVLLLPVTAAGASVPHGSTGASSAPATSDTASKVPPAPAGGVLVRGPRMYNPNTNSAHYSYYSHVIVSQVANLVNQVVQVNWYGFTPSDSATYVPTSTNYPVEVAECAGTDPKSPNDCFGANNSGVQGSFSNNGPMNTSYAVTAPNGTGVADIQLLTAEQNQQLGCNKDTPCSLVVVPAQGGNTVEYPINCNDHSQDLGGTAIGNYAFTTAYGQCSWKARIVIPLYFSPTPSDCPVRNPDFSVIGSPMLARAMFSWQAELCTIADPISIQYDSAQNEPLARTDFQDGLDDVALTTYPATGSSQYPFTYAPVAISAESVAFWVDNPNTGLPIYHIRLDARLVLKLLTQSYNFSYQGCGDDKPTTTCNNAVDGDPSSLFTDPEFEQLNKHVLPVGPGWQVPTVLSGESDMTWALTSWIAASKPAKSFADGTFDPWGEHVNTNYLDMQLPTQTLSAMDPYPTYAHLYDPYFPLSAVAQYQVDNWDPATQAQPDAQGNYDAVEPEIPGNRSLFAILDQGDAASFLLPAASLENAYGNYVGPTQAGMLAAVEHDMITNRANHITQGVNFANTGKGAADAYPLTMVIYAMVPTGGISKQKAAKIAEWLDFVAEQGQQQGEQPGNLPPGYLPLTAQMRQETLEAATEVLDQAGDHKSKPSASAGPSSALPTASPTPSTSTPTVHLGYVANPSTSGLARYAVPVLLVVGAMLAVAGSFSLAIGRGGAAVLARLRRVSLLRRKKQ
jgi:hypothetical protein